MYWLDFWDRVRRQINPRRLIVVGDVNSAFHEQRPNEETRRDIGGQPMEHPEEMLPTVPDFIAALRKEMGDPGASERKIKTQFTKLTTQVNREATEARNREKRKT